jgi:hypothetical protein
MIPYDFSYLRPESIGEAVDAFAELDAAKKNPITTAGAARSSPWRARGRCA